MPTTRYRRQFSAGSRPTPDPYDKFLDLEGFYRKHTARDATCLFRTISEQLYDNQEYHEQIRKDCVNYLIKHRDQYEHLTPFNFNEYTCQMAKPTTYGTFLELRAIGYMYKRNILLYQPYDLGMWLVKEPEYTDTFRIFFAPEKHFDSVFTKPFIVKAAFCQSICYELLYKNVFKLPDVEYSVEAMLHGVTNGYATENYGDESCTNHIVLDDGRKFQLDKPGKFAVRSMGAPNSHKSYDHRLFLPENTLCILDNAALCHFHNPDFEVIANQINKYSNPNDVLNMQRMMNAALPDKYISCVRQLLNEGITPFPYKVAKALDPDIYRNIEFDSWSDVRKEMLSKAWYNGGWNFQIGVKCLVKLYESQDDLYKCHIQEMSPNKGPCIVFVEALAEKHSVAYSRLQPIDDAKAWALPHRLKRNRDITANAYDLTRKYSLRHQSLHDKKQLTYKKYQKCADIDSDLLDCSKSYESRLQSIDKLYDIDSYTDLSYFQPYSLDLVAMPLNTYYRQNNNSGGGGGGGGGNNHNANSNQNQKNQSSTQQQKNGRNAQQTSAQTESSVQLLKRDADEEKEFPSNEHQQAGTPSLQQSHGMEHHVDMCVPPPSMPVHYANNGGYVQYYYPGAECVDPNYYNVPAEMVTSQPMYQVPPQAYATTPIPMPAVNPYAVAPALSANQMYSMPMAGWPNASGVTPTTYYVSAPSPTIPIGHQGLPPLPIRHRELLRIHGRINMNPSPSLSPVGTDLPMNDRPTIRFFYNMGIEFFRNLQATYGMNQVLSMLESENGCADTSCIDYDSSGQLSNDFQQIAFESNEPEVPQTPHKERFKHYEGYYQGPTCNQNRRPNLNTNYRKETAKPNNKSHQRNYNSYASNAPKPLLNNKNGPKHYHGYDSTPKKDANGNHQQYYESNNNVSGNNKHAGNGNNSTKRDNVYATPDASSTLPTPTHSPYVSPYMPYVSFDGNVEHPPMYMPMNMFPSPGYSQMPQPPYCPMPIATQCDPDAAESFNNSPGACYNAAPYGLAPNYWCPAPQPTPLPVPLPAPNHLVPPPQSSLNSSNISSTSSNANSGNASNPSN